MTVTIWQQCLSSLQQELSSQQFNTWIRPLTVDESIDSPYEFCLLAPNRFILDWVNDKFLSRIKELVQHFFSDAQLPSPQKIMLKVSTELQPRFSSRGALSRRSSSTPPPQHQSLSTFERNTRQEGPLSDGLLGLDTQNHEINEIDSRRLDTPNAHLTSEENAGTVQSLGSSPSTISRPEDIYFQATTTLSDHKTNALGSTAIEPSMDEKEPAAYPAPTSSRSTIVGTNSAEGGLQHRSALNKAFTFDSFVEGKSNQMGLAAAQQVVENPGGSYNPLFIYGGVGLGKTHLMHAVGNEMQRRNPNAKIVYLHSERFVADMVKALQLNAINDFKRYYRSVDALLIDDIQFFAGKDRSQEEFFHTFNALLEGNQQIILTCDRYPKVINNLEERLKSRFGWGLTIEVEPPELETRAAILLKRAEEINIDLSYDAAFFIAKRVRSNVRELEGALKRVIANATFTQRAISVDLVKEALKDLLALQDKQVSIGNIQKVVGEYYKVKMSDLLSKRRSRSVARPRQVAMALAKELTNHSLPEIGDAFGGRDHTTVLHACRKIKELSDVDTEIQQDIKNLQRQLTT